MGIGPRCENGMDTRVLDILLYKKQLCCATTDDGSNLFFFGFTKIDQTQESQNVNLFDWRNTTFDGGIVTIFYTF